MKKKKLFCVWFAFYTFIFFAVREEHAQDLESIQDPEPEAVLDDHAHEANRVHVVAVLADLDRVRYHDLEHGLDLDRV